MYKNVLRAIADVGVFGSISIILFFTVFVAVVWYVVRANRKFIQHMENLPLEDSAN